MQFATLAEMIRNRIASSPELPAFQVKRGESYVPITWAQVAPRLETIAAGLVSAVPLPDDAHITIIGNTSLDWVVCDLAALSIGIRTVPVYASLLPSEVGYMHADTQAQIAIVEDADQLEKVRAMRAGFTFFNKEYTAAEVPLKHIVVIDPSGVAPADDWESLAELEARGKQQLDALRKELERRRGTFGRHDTATYTYTSGTTGAPKAVIQTHHNMLSMLENIEALQYFDRKTLDGGLFLFLPLAHSFGRLIELSAVYFDSALIVASVPTLLEDLQASRPGFFPSAPRVYEKIRARIESTVATASPTRQRLFRWAMGVGEATIAYRAKGRSIPMVLGLQLALADRLVLSRLRGRLGLDRTGVALSGSAPLAPEVHRFFLAMGVPLIEAYGLTETCPGLTTNLPTDFKIGTVGKSFPGIEVRIAPDGEILAKGENITKGYLNRPDATEAAFDDEGWFCTGDLGSKDDEGFIKITGRKKELIKTSGGKYVAPAKIEGMIKLHPIIQEAVVVGDRRNYCVGLVSIDLEELGTWAQAQGVPAEPASAAVKEAVQHQIDEVNAGLASFETIKYFRLLPEPLTVANGLLTASLKVKRSVVEEQFAALIDEMYN